MMTFQVHLKMARKPNQPRLRFYLEKLRNPAVACTFQATIGGKFAPLIGLSDEDMDMEDSEGSEESKGGLDRCSVRGD